MRSYQELLKMLHPYDIETQTLILLALVRGVLNETNAIKLQLQLLGTLPLPEVFHPERDAIILGWIVNSYFATGTLDKKEQEEIRWLIAPHCFDLDAAIFVLRIICVRKPVKQGYVLSELHRFIDEQLTVGQVPHNKEKE